MFRSRALAIVSGELANPGVALAKGDMEGMALCLPNLTLLLHMLLRIPTMLILVFWVCCFFFSLRLITGEKINLEKIQRH